MNDFEQGNIHYMAKEYYEASECYRRFLEQEPNNYVVWHNLGIALSQLDKNVEALASYSAASYENETISAGEMVKGKSTATSLTLAPSTSTNPPRT